MKWPARHKVRLLDTIYRGLHIQPSLNQTYIYNTLMIFMRWPRPQGIMSHESIPRSSLNRYFVSDVKKINKHALLLYMEGTFEQCIENANMWGMTMNAHDVHIFTDKNHDTINSNVQQHHIH